MNPQQLAEIKRLAGEATHGKWTANPTINAQICYGVYAKNGWIYSNGGTSNNKFVAAANPEAILKLIDSYEKLVKCVEFYGNWKNWEWDHAGNYAELTTIKNDACEMEYAENDGDVFSSRVGGKLARETLKEVGHEGGET
jgi:hypothetical protein